MTHDYILFLLGEVVVRPSSKGADHLTITWKVADKIYQHVDIREEGKANAFSLGSSLLIGTEEYEDLDEIIARYINPMAAHARDLLYFKYYRDTEGGAKDKAEELLKEEKKKNASKIHYFISSAKNYPGKFLLSYLPRAKCRHEYVTVTPDGFRFRQQMFDSVTSLFKWFKEHFRDPIPGATPSTPRGNNTSRTPYNISTPNNMGMNTEAIHRVAQNLPSHMLQSLSAVANQTPHYPHTPGGGYAAGGYINTPYTPSGQTPFMTPYQTPRYGQHTPGHNMGPPPHMSGGFLHPGSVTPAHRSSHHHHQMMEDSPRSNSRAYNSANDPSDWQKAAEAWARNKTPHDDRSSSRGSSGQRTPRYVFLIFLSICCLIFYDCSNYRYDDMRSRKGGMPSKSPRSGRSTPRTNTSPRSMSLGDATPLYDEN